MGADSLAVALAQLRDVLGAVRLPFDLPGSTQAATQAREATAQLDDYVLPRLARLEAPLLAVVGGSTGAGKSTLVNSVIGRTVSTPGVIRPTTRSPVLVHHPADASWFTSDRILPGLARTHQPAHDPRTVQVVAEPTLPRGLAILDAPDVDSVVAENRALATQLLAAADLWLFVTSAARYADAVPWDYLRQAAERRAVVAVVLDRVPPAAMVEVPAHLGQMMSQRGLADSPLFAVPETTVDAAGLLPDSAVAPIRGWLADLAQDAVARQSVVLQTLDGAIAHLAGLAPQVADAVDAQRAALATLSEDAEKSYAEAVRTIAVQTADGSLLRGEVLARWQDFVGTGEFFRAVEQKVGWLRDRMMAAVRGEPKQAIDVSVAVESGMEVLIREEGEAAAVRTASAWEAHPAGRQLLGTADDLSRASADFDLAARRTVRDWQADVMELVSELGAAKRSRARFWALGVNGVGVALMILVFSQTAGLTGAELGIAGGTAVLAQRVLEAIFGEDQVRKLAKQAKDQLDGRVQVVMATELARYLDRLAAVDVRGEQAEALRAAVAAIEPARRELSLPALPVVDQPAVPAAPAIPELDAATTRPAITGEVVEGTVLDPEEDG
ncbi:MAG: GTPase domain-containing protein [Propionicimonas sp.]|uniref:GTPase domain-containing protein n=1 Tax=Propionicimonas sp. TaxID=1955623 RepID=UPI002B209D0A|nr:GTPase domain-containing protein [Propionicimonas sp.]MEA4944492.1 GTPase domain-containing protein [Propionicimonas sp.]